MSDGRLRGLGERDLLPPLVRWLRARRQLRDDSILVEEFPWHGRRIDLALLTASGSTSAFELKLAHNRRALEQSYLNGVPFDRAYVVTATMPSEANIAQARVLGLGIVHVTPASGRTSLLLSSRRTATDPSLKGKLRASLVRLGAFDV